MNKGVLQSSPVQQLMAAANPSWWNLHHQHHFIRPPPPPSSPTNFLTPPNNYCYNNINDTTTNNNHIIIANNNTNSSSSNLDVSMPSSSWVDDDSNRHQEHEQQHHFPHSWNQLLLPGGVCLGDQVMLNSRQHSAVVTVNVKQESSTVDSQSSNSMNNSVYSDHEFQLTADAKAANFSSAALPHHHQQQQPTQMNDIILVSSPQSSCVTTFSGSHCNSMLDFSPKSADHTLHARHPAPDPFSECDSRLTDGTLIKKAKVQQSSAQSTVFKVRKEKLGDRITALHQLVSPFGKTDTASVLLEAIGYIRFLQNQIVALSLPYLSSASGNKRQPHHVQGEGSCIFPEDPGQLLNNNCLKRKEGPHNQESHEEAKEELRSRGLCLVPVSCTSHVGSDNAADFWAPPAFR